MKNILFISPTGGYAGIDVCLESLVLGIDRNKYNPICVFPNDSILKNRFELQGIRCYSLPLNWWFPIGFSGSDILHVLPTIRDKVDPLIHIIKDNSIDIVFSNTSVNLDGAIAAAICNVPHIFFLHAKYVDNIYVDMNKETKAFVYQLMGKLSYKLVCCSRLLHEFISEYSSNSIYIYNGVDTEKFAYTKRIYNKDCILNMICVGHYNANKQQDFVLRAIGHIKQIRPDLIKNVKFTMVGPGEQEYLKSLKGLVSNLQIKDNVVFKGFRDDVNTYLDNFDIYINSSISENLPLSVIEAMSKGMPVLAVPNDGTLQLVCENQTGYICNTPEEMADKIIKIIENPGLIEELSLNARNRACEHFSLERYILNFENLFDETIPTNVCDNFVNNLYESIAGYSISKLPKVKVLLIYPKEASATYFIAGKHPLDYLSSLNKVEYKEVCESEFECSLVDSCDIVYCLRYYHDFAYNVLKYTKKQNKPFIWFIDDNYFALTYKEGEVVHQKTENSLFKRMFEESESVIVNSDELFHTGNLLKSNIHRFPTYQLTSENIPKVESQKIEKVIRFGFMGTLKRDNDFDCVVSAIEKIQKEYGETIEIDFIGYYPSMLSKTKNVNHFDFISDYDKFREFFKARDWDFALAPLRDTDFNKSKTNNKYREYSGFKIAGIYSDIKTYNSCITNNYNGLLVKNTTDDWYKAIKLLIENKEVRENIAEQAFADIKQNYSIENFSKKLLYNFNRNLKTSVQISQLQTNPITQEITKVLDPNMLCYSGVIYNKRKYSVLCDNNHLSKIGIVFASEAAQVKGDVTINLYVNGMKMRQVTKSLEEISLNNWTFFSFQKIYNCGGAKFTIEFDFKYISGNMGVFEDRNYRTFIYKVFNKLKYPLKGKNTLIIDWRE